MITELEFLKWMAADIIGRMPHNLIFEKPKGAKKKQYLEGYLKGRSETLGLMLGGIECRIKALEGNEFNIQEINAVCVPKRGHWNYYSHNLVEGELIRSGAYHR